MNKLAFLLSGIFIIFTVVIINNRLKFIPLNKIPISPMPTKTISSVKLKIYLVMLDDQGSTGKKIGCGDSLVPVEISVLQTATPLRTALVELLSLKEQSYGQSGLYNSLYQSDLSLQSINITEGEAIIKLTGSLKLGGVCDNPRVSEQLRGTALQFSTIKKVAIFINDIPLEQALSLK